MKNSFLIIALMLLSVVIATPTVNLAGCFSPPKNSPNTVSPLCGGGGTIHGLYFDNIVTVMMENTGLNASYRYTGSAACTSTTNCYVIGNTNAPFMSAFEKVNAFSEGYSGLFHPSEPNYLALTSGSNDGVTTDGVCCFSISATNIIDRSEERRVGKEIRYRWSVYLRK